MLNFDHLIIAVRDLDVAIADYQQLGFTVYYGGKHTHKPTHNGLIALADGSYLELLAPVNPHKIDPTIDVLAHGEGFGGYALLSANLEADLTRLRAAGIHCSDAQPGHRDRYDNVVIQWRSANVGATRNPFLITDVTPHILRVPDDPDKIYQPNGAVGISGLTVVVPNMAAALVKYGAMLDAPPLSQHTDHASHTTHFALGNCALTLIEPLTAGSPWRQTVEQQGEAVVQLQLYTTTGSIHVGLLDRALAHGAQIELVATARR